MIIEDAQSTTMAQAEKGHTRWKVKNSQPDGRLPRKRVLFYYLSAFAHTGGIEKFNRCFIKALNEIGVDPDSTIVSVYDDAADPRYNTALPFKGFQKRKLSSVLYVLWEALRADIVVIGHLNLAAAGWLIKFLRPQCQVMVVAHGIEAWQRQQFFRRWLLRKADRILSVSNYTKNQLVLRNGVAPEKIELFPNTLDPYFTIPQVFGKPGYLMERYNIGLHQPVILTLSRLSSSEQYKGYDAVIGALPAVLEQYPEARYILAGKYDAQEKQRIDQLVQLYGVQGQVIMPGFIADEEVADHYQLADVFIMPSRKEGFGIVFLEALACGTAVVGGNQDGTVDALLNGSLGTLINPTNRQEISNAIIHLVGRKKHQPLYHQGKVLDQYRFSRYKERLERQII